ncbi:C-GCAxxG-C-C family (seleno)protein [Thermodesulfobacteriota bacterium]
MKNGITRRRMLQIGGAALGGTMLYRTNSVAGTGEPGGLPWTWKKIKPESIQERAYQSAWAKIGCMYGVVESVIGTLADKYGSPYDTFPVAATVYGSGGVGGVGSLCGTVNAAGLLFGLFIEKQEDLFQLCNEISLWYEKTSMPVYRPLKPVQDIPIASSVSGSNLCHISCTKWSNVSGHQLMTMPHFERCNRIVADMAMKIVTMLNQYADMKLEFNEKPNSFSQGCMSCHGPEKEKGDVSINMSCDTCHDNPH